MPAHEIVHVGDDPELDVAGARQAGMRAIWLNRHAREWPLDGVEPDGTITTLAELEPELDRLHHKANHG